MVAIRHEWISKTQFEPLQDRDALIHLKEKIKSRAESARTVIFDLDSTLYHVEPRTHFIIQEFLTRAKDPEKSGLIREHSSFAHVTDAKLKPIIEELQAKLEVNHVGYSLRDTFTAVGMDSHQEPYESLFRLAKHYWDTRFFSNDYLDRDVVYPGALDYVNELYDLGANIVYLTGRDEGQMGDGSRARLQKDKFPWNEKRTELVLKDHRTTDDLHHKVKAVDLISAKWGALAGSFENEPKNLVAMQERAPQAMHFFIETSCSDHPAPIGRGIYRIKGYL